jgi:hypothetical protein
MVHIAANIFYHGNDCICLITYTAICTEHLLEAFLQFNDYDCLHSYFIVVGGERIFKIIKLY